MVLTKLRRLGVDTKFNKFGVETKFKRLGDEINPALPRPVVVD